tara:strand:+ start:560 stop:1006 length:447 start_codon:yes stop_codon:yes gene_type:complete
LDDKEKDKMSEMSKQSEVGVQVRCQYSENRIHIQGIGETDNRPYGLSMEIRVPPSVTDWLAMQKPTRESKATSGAMLYVPVRVLGYGDEKYQMLIASTVDGGDPHNHTDGMMLNIKNDTMNNLKFLEWCKTSEVIEDVEGEPYTQESE